MTERINPSQGAKGVPLGFAGFGGSYPSDNAVCIRGASFMNLSGQKYTPLEGSLKVYEPHKMVWTPTEDGVLAPFYLPSKTQQVNVKACLSGSTDCCWNACGTWQERKGSPEWQGMWWCGDVVPCFLVWWFLSRPSSAPNFGFWTFKVYRWMWSPTRILGRGWIFPESKARRCQQWNMMGDEMEKKQDGEKTREENWKLNPWKLGVFLFEVMFFSFSYPFGSLNMFRKAGIPAMLNFPELELAATQAVLEACSSSFQLPMALRILKDMLRLEFGGSWRAC